ncbi:MAG: hypothetical protein ACE5NG_16665, partial [bacterium]
LVSEQEYQYEREHTGRILKMKIGNKLAFEYLDEMMADVTIQLVPEAIKLIMEQLRKVVQRPPSQFDSMSEFQLNEKELQDLEEPLWELRNQPALYLNGKAITIAEFVGTLTFVPYSALRRDIRTVLNYVIRDLQLTEEARRMGLHRSSRQVQRKVALYEDYLLSKLMRQRIVDGIRITEEEVKEKYEELKAKKKLRGSFEKNRDVVYYWVSNQRRRTEISNYLKAEKSKLDIKTYPEVLHEYYDQLLSGTEKSIEDQ